MSHHFLSRNIIRFSVICLSLLGGCSVLAQVAQKAPNPLLSAAFWQGKPSLEAVKAEVAKGADPSELNGAAYDPVALAINNNAANEVVLYLLEHENNRVDKITHDGRTYIFWAANRGNVALMNHFMEKGAKLDVLDSHGYSVFNFAAATGQQNTAVYELLLKHGAQPVKELTREGANALLLAIALDPEGKLTQYFQNIGLSLNSKDADGATAFDYAAKAGAMPMMRSLLQKGVRPTPNALLFAAAGSRRGANPLPVFQYLDSLGLSANTTNKEGNNVLHILARRAGQTNIIQHYINRGVSASALNKEGYTPFHVAAASNRELSTLVLLRPSVKNINAPLKNGSTALALAVRNNSLEVVEYLLGEGANVNTTDAAGNTLVSYLLESYSPQNAKMFEGKLTLLKAKGLNLALPQKEGNTAWHLAVVHNDVGLLKSIQPIAGDINARNREGLTPLHKAAMVSKDSRLMQYLLSMGAKKELKTSFEETAYDLAKENEILTKEAVSLEFLK